MTIAVVGTGTIGLGWIALFAGYGERVRVVSTRSDAEAHVREAMRLHLPGVPVDDRLEFEPDLDRAVRGVAAVQENAPEDLPLKRQLLGRIDRAADPATPLLSSTSTLPPDAVADALQHPGRFLVGHPFNPPHVVPLVEVVPGRHTTTESTDAAVALYRRFDRRPVVIRRAVPGFVANRLQSALLREAIHLVSEGVVTAAELDEVVMGSLGLRWATVGPFLAAHLAGGAGGLRAWLQHIGAGLEGGWALLGAPRMDDTTRDTLLDQVSAEYGDDRYETHVTERDARQRAVLAALQQEAP